MPNKEYREERNVFLQILLGIWKVIKTIVVSIYRFFDAIKFAFSIPMLSLAASIFTFCFIIFIKPFINFLPDFLNSGLIETFVAAVIFVGLKFLIFNDKLQHDYEFKHYSYIVSFALTILIWLIPIFFIEPEALNIQTFLEEGRSFSFASTLFVVFYSPHLWLSTITKEFFFSIGINLVINCAVFIGLATYASNLMVQSAYED